MDKTFCLVVLGLIYIFHGTSCFLQGSKQRCDNEGEIIELDFIKDSNIQCSCQKGWVKCAKTKCPSLEGCHMVPFKLSTQSTQCSKCMGCTVDGVYKESDNSWTDTDQPCLTHHCQAGVVSTARALCPRLNCTNQIQEAGACCPSCASCEFNGVRYTEGEVFQPYTDKCIDCKCKDGKANCAKPSCPVLNCPDSKIVHQQGDCCPKCTGMRETFLIPNMCLFRYKVYGSGQSVQVDNCTSCTCMGVTMQCNTETCPITDCPSERLIYPTDKSCCPVCQAEVTYQGCQNEGEAYEHGETWKNDCTQCTCYDGIATCRVPECESSQSCPLDTHELIFKRDNPCCPVCQERGGLCTVFGDPHYVTFDKEMFDFQGTCRYLLSKDCSHEKKFSIYTQNFDRYNMPGAWTKSVTINIGEERVSLQKSGKVRINKKGVSLPFTTVGVYTVRYDNLNIIVEAEAIGLTVVWNTESYLEVHLDASYKGKTCGLCGNFNGQNTDDFTGKDGRLYFDSALFAQTWTHGKKKTCDVGSSQREVQSKCQDNFSQWRRAHHECAALRSQSMKKCRKRINVDPYYKSCITDSCNCPSNKKCTCDAITAYVRECERAGLVSSEKELDYPCASQRQRINRRAHRRRLL